MNINKTINLLFCFFLIYSCKTSYVHVYRTNSDNVQTEQGLYTFENDSLRIVYDIWSEKGLVTFSIYNKSNVPLYIDWKKSSYIDNSVKLNYWINEEREKSVEVYGSRFYTGPNQKPGESQSTTTGISSTSTVKIERITFIPPKSHYFRSQFYIMPISYFKLPKNSKMSTVQRNDALKKETNIYSVKFDKENSPLIFRNFLTFSYQENFEKEFYIDNEFFLSEVLEMDKKHFAYYKLEDNGRFLLMDENGNPILISPFEDRKSFYLNISTSKSVKGK